MTSYYIHNTFTYLNKFVLNEKLNVYEYTHDMCKIKNYTENYNQGNSEY